MHSNNGYNHHANHGQFLKMFKEAFPGAPKGTAEEIYDRDRCDKLYPSFANMYRLALNHARHKHTAYAIELQANQARIKAKYNIAATETLETWTAAAAEALPLFSMSEEVQ